jgi:hypothetical protein
VWLRVRHVQRMPDDVGVTRRPWAEAGHTALAMAATVPVRAAAPAFAPPGSPPPPPGAFPPTADWANEDGNEVAAWERSTLRPQGALPPPGLAVALEGAMLERLPGTSLRSRSSDSAASSRRDWHGTSPIPPPRNTDTNNHVDEDDDPEGLHTAPATIAASDDAHDGTAVRRVPHAGRAKDAPPAVVVSMPSQMPQPTLGGRVAVPLAITFHDVCLNVDLPAPGPTHHQHRRRLCPKAAWCWPGKRCGMPTARRAVLDHVEAHVPAGSMVALMGPSGSGKTTLLSLLGGRLPMPWTGHLRFGHLEPSKALRK